MPRMFPLSMLLRVALVCLIVALASTLKARAAEPIGGPFSLTAHTGERLSDQDLKGRPYAVFFGFTHCPDVCPTALFELAQVLQNLGPDGDAIMPLFVTVDPARDTQEILSEYVKHFDPRIVALRGSEEETAAVARSFRATYRKVDTGDGSYTMDHSAAVYLIDRNGRFVEAVDYRAPLKVQVEKFRKAIAAR